MKLVNLTPHEINIVCGDGRLSLPVSGDVARIPGIREPCGAIDVDGWSVDISAAVYNRDMVRGLPDPEEGVGYIVSSLVLEVVQDRKDVFSPGPGVRNDDGMIVACNGLSCTPAFYGG